MIISPQEEVNLIAETKLILAHPASINHLNIDRLRELLRYHEWRYYIKNDPVIGDTEYDVIYKLLKKRENDHPELITPDSPTQRVSQDLSGDLPSVEHNTPMLSLDNSYSAADLKKFDEQVRKLAAIPAGHDILYTVEPKLDGGSVALVYENDYFVRGATRGNGIQGEDITPNMRGLPTVPLRTEFTKSGIVKAEIRGEAVINKKRFIKINTLRESQGLGTFANPRNAAAGGLRTKNPNETRERGVDFFGFQLAYAIDSEDNNVLNRISTHAEQLALLDQLGFQVHLDQLLCNGIEEVIRLVDTWNNRRDKYPYEIDGLVIKVNDVAIQERCGFTQHHPRWAIAYKFQAKQATTRLLNVEYQVGKVGSITPVAKVEPVHLAGVTISSISLHNEEFIRSKDLRIGDHVVVERAGDVIPYIVKSLDNLRTGQEVVISFPTICPADPLQQAQLAREEDEAAWRCHHCTCGIQKLQKLIFHVSKDGMDVDGFGRSYVERFYQLGWVQDLPDIYNLDYAKISQLEGFGAKSAENLKKAIEAAKKNPLQKLLASLSIHHLGKKASKIISERINNVLDLAHWTIEDYTAIKDVGPVLAQNMVAYFSSEANIDMLRKMESFGVNLSQTAEDKPLSDIGSLPLAGKSILFTGSLEKMTRDEASKFAEQAGAKTISAVSSKLNILVVGANAGSKLTKAQALGTVTIWSEDQFLEAINYSPSH